MKTTRHGKTKFFIEASAIAEPRMSGIGHSILATIRALYEIDEFTANYDIVLLVSGDMKKNLARWEFPADKVSVKSIGWEKHVLQVLLKYRLLPPMDLFLGRGVYLFPNYKNWPLLFSRSITYVYDVVFAIFPETVQPKNLAMLQKNIPHWVRRTDFVVTISQASRQEILQYLGLAPDKVGVVYCGVDTTEYYRRPESEITRIKEKYNISGEYLFFVGNMEPRKNLNRLLEAYEALPVRLTDKYALVLVGGGGWLNEETVKLIGTLRERGLSIIHPETYVPDEDLPAFYSGASALVHPAIHEGFGLPPLQAMACGVPVVVSDIPAAREVIGNNGVYFDPMDVDSIGKGLQAVLRPRGDKRKLLAAAKERSEAFDWYSAARQLVKYVERTSIE